MRSLLACTCLTPILLVAQPALAEVTVSTATTAPLNTANVANGAADDIRVTSTGSIKPTSGTAITIGSNDDARNEGTIEIRDANDAAGIVALPGFTGNIVNSGIITIDETYEQKDADNDKDLDGPFAIGARRFAIRVAPGGTFTGNVTHSGTILVEGNQSAGIAVDSRLNGSLTSTGRITVIGTDATGIRAGDVTGNVILHNSIIVNGQNAVGVSLDGDIGGRLIVQSAITASGYRYLAAPDKVELLDADDLLQGGPALRIAGDVAGGILLDTAQPDNVATDPDEDKDGIPDAQETNAVVSSAGSAAAMQIGATSGNVAIGAVAGQANGHGLVIKGTAAGGGVFAGVDGNGVTIGGLGGTVQVSGGATVQGTVTAASNGANATALRIGSGASVPELIVSGTVGASGGKALESRVTAVQIDAGAAIGSINNSGLVSAQSAEKGSAYAIRDSAGTLNFVTNSGDIIAKAGSPEGSAVAIDVSANNLGVTVRQLGIGQNDTPTITGDIRFGGGNDVLQIEKGTVAGLTTFGGGANRLSITGVSAYSGTARFGAGADIVTLGDTGQFLGELDFGGGNDQLILGGTSTVLGTLRNSAGVAAQVNGGALLLTNEGDVALSSLSVANNGTIGISIDGAKNIHTRYVVGGAANFAAGSKLLVTLANIRESEGSYVVVDAGTLTGGTNLAPDAAALPFLFKSSLATNAAAGEVTLTVQRKSADELGLNRSQSQAYAAIYDVLDNDAKVAASFLAVDDGDAFRANIRQMMPDHAGGVFEAVTQGSRATARFLSDPDFSYAEQGGVGFWLQQVAWGTSKGLGDTSSYDITGWGATGGADVSLGGAGRAGFTLAYLTGRDADGGTDNEVTSSQYELGLHWRGSWGGALAFARVSAATVNFEGRRSFSGVIGTEAVDRSTAADWNGKLYSAAGGLAYEHGMGRLSVRPGVSLDYYRLSEDGYAEAGGGKAFDLTVEDRTSDELAANATVTVGYDLATGSAEQARVRVELEGGRRQIVGGTMGQTVAQFEGGEAFTLDPEARTDGWLSRLRLMGGLAGFMLGGEFSAEEQQGRAAVALRASLRLGF